MESSRCISKYQIVSLCIAFQWVTIFSAMMTLAYFAENIQGKAFHSNETTLVISVQQQNTMNVLLFAWAKGLHTSACNKIWPTICLIATNKASTINFNSMQLQVEDARKNHDSLSPRSARTCFIARTARWGGGEIRPPCRFAPMARKNTKFSG